MLKNIFLLISALFISLAGIAFADDFANISLISAKKYLGNAKQKLNIEILYPYLPNESFDNNPTNTFNDVIEDALQQEVTSFKEMAKENKGEARRPTANALNIDYNSAIIKPSHHAVISVRFNIEGYVSGMAHPYHYHQALNYDLENAKTLALDDLFSNQTNYLQVISQYCQDELNKKLVSVDRTMIQTGTAPKSDNYKNWNLLPNGLLITFDAAQVAPSVYGTQTVLIPYQFLKPLVSKEAPIASCTIHPRKCRSDLLSGGFLESAIETGHRGFDPRLS